MRISSDEIVILKVKTELFGDVILNATIIYTWIVMAILVIGSWAITRRLSSGLELSRGQNLLEAIVSSVTSQIKDVGEQEPGPFVAFIGTLFIFIATSTLLGVVPGFLAPTGSLSTTVALAICVFLAVPIFGISKRGFGEYIRSYLRPTPLMLPFNIISELSRTIALAVRLYGNVMSGTVIAAILLGVAPIFFPVLMQLLGLLTGVIQAYIFAVLAMVYIASATSAQPRTKSAADTRHGTVT